jgi:hypothetical protein
MPEFISVRKRDRILHKIDTEMWIWVVDIAARFINSECVVNGRCILDIKVY